MANYPFNEFMPCLEANDGYLWNHMAEQDSPFRRISHLIKHTKRLKAL